ncbi:DeoR/GlpR family DNA-binding transcription regulator [Paracoccus tegillarcae]|uniref:DeoR/GlpR transcriptional regulator n=1 Tax=Paracoccus tegillarcae TaxID=1529068 RepID=A0A2K9EG84_9RHOB|nr:DeoR/GlpR family DNA-binding transcription regulator [Paracoccus tegillarcae]AUH33953.1 DeoR/GlpR transcriptional regulator [Paracoccus tegillarcae]
MKPRERRLQIEGLIREQGAASVEALADRFTVSTETIRRDLSQLAEAGRIIKVHGGARSTRLLNEPSMPVRAGLACGEKARIGRRLAEAIGPGDTLFIDTGSTTLAAAAALAQIAGLTIITNSLRLAETLTLEGSDADIHLLGGRYAAENAQTVGPSVLGQIAEYQADHCVLTVAALSPEVGAMDASHDEAQIARTMLANARNLIVLADSTKLGRRAAFTVCRTDRIGLIITDDRISTTAHAAFDASGVAVWT